MLTRLLFLMGLTGCGIVVLTGAWPASITPSAAAPEVAFAPQPFPLDADLTDPNRLLERSLASFANEPWLHVKIRQTVAQGDQRFTATGFLQRGPNQCARMEMEIAQGNSSSRLVIVSDGESLAQVQKIAAACPTAHIERLPAGADGETFLAKKGCAGPAALLETIRRHSRHGRVQTGQLAGRAVIELQADFDPEQIPAFAGKNLNSLTARVYFDANTLWPTRIEWWSAGPLVQFDFRDPSVGVPLNAAECAHMFSYQPDGSERVTAR